MNQWYCSDLCGDSDVKEVGWVDGCLLKTQVGRSCRFMVRCNLMGCLMDSEAVLGLHSCVNVLIECTPVKRAIGKLAVPYLESPSWMYFFPSFIDALKRAVTLIRGSSGGEKYKMDFAAPIGR